MTTLAQRSFAAGELAPALYPRVDQAKYAVGLRTCRNFMIMRQGGAANRPGTGFVAEAGDSSRKVRLLPFVFNDDQTYVMEFGHQYIRFHRNGAQITETEKAITGATKANPCVITSASHGFSDGDEVAISGVGGMTELNGRNFKVADVTSNTFSLKYMDGTAVNSTAFGTYTSGGSCARVYTIASPYVEDDLFELRFVQSADVVTIVHANYSPREMSRLDHTSWTLTEIALAPAISAPGGVSNNGAGGSTTEWVVTAVAEESFEESVASSSTGSSATPSSGSPITVSWSAVEGAVQYNVYKKTNGIYGFIGTAGGTDFIDNGITPDATDTPPTDTRIVSDLQFALSKLVNPSTLPASNGKSAAWTSDGVYLAVAHASSPYVTVYKKSGSVLTKLPNPSTLPAGNANCVAWGNSASSTPVLGVAHASSPYITLYELSGDVLTKMSDPDVLPTGTGNGCAFVGSSYLAIAHDSSPYVSFYQLGDFGSGVKYYKLNNPTTLPTGNGNGVCFCDAVFVVAHDSSPYISIYGFPASVGYPNAFVKLSNPSSLPTGNGNGCAWNGASRYLAVAHDTSPYVTVYKSIYTGGFSKIANPVNLPAGNGSGCGWSSDGLFLVVSHATSPFVTIYRRDVDVLTKLSDPDDLPASTGNGVVWSPDDAWIVVAHDSSPYITIYEIVSVNPSVVGYFQQRLILAATDRDPDKLWASKNGSFKNFTLSVPVRDDDAVVFRVPGTRVRRIMHVLDLNRLVILTSSGELVAEGDESGVLKPTAVNAKLQSSNGSSSLAPLIVNDSALYVQARGAIVRDLGFDFQSEGYRGNDLTIFSSHLFQGKELVDWAFQQSPHSIVWVVRDDGILLGMTYLREQQLVAWHRHDFDGEVESVCGVPEGTEDAVYLVIKRSVGGVERRYIERMKTRLIEDIVDAVLLDCSLTYDGRNTDESHTMELSGGTNWDDTEELTLTSSQDFFTVAEVGNAIHLTGEDGTVIRFRITGYTSATVVTGRTQKDVPSGMRESAISDWARAVDQLSGLWHLEGKEVGVFADGFVVASPNNAKYTTVTVEDGAITLPDPYTVIHVGLPITADLETLDVDTFQGETMIDKAKMMGKVSMWVEKSRGAWVGPRPPSDDDENPLEDLTEVTPRSTEDYDEPPSLDVEKMEVSILPEWNTNGRVFVRQVDPLPLSVLGIAPAGFVPFRR